MNTDKKHRVCPVEHANALDFTFRRLIHNPKKILKPYVKEGMTAMDLGCGPGFFTMEMARLAGRTGMVTAADLQEGMLAIVRNKIQNSDMADRVKFHLCRTKETGLSEKFDFILIFYMLHEVPDPLLFLKEIKNLLKAKGNVLLVEPKWHVSRSEFLDSIGIMKQAGFAVLAEPKIGFSRTVVIGDVDLKEPRKQA
jgi:ubiquinone/menaquinone biosynthesis C-methylase UbiE